MLNRILVVGALLLLCTVSPSMGNVEPGHRPTAQKQTRPRFLQVLGANLRPLSDATVYRDERLLGKTDEKGILSFPDWIELPARLRIEHPAYVPQKLEIPPLTAHPTYTIRLKHVPAMMDTVAVTAVTSAQSVATVSRAQTNLDLLDIQEAMPTSITDLVQQTAAGSFVGSGGFSTTPSIRGLARRRILILLDGVRVISDRRAGTSAAFIPPNLIRSFELIRSSGSVHLGSDAMGGVLSMHTTDADNPNGSRTEATCHFGTNGSVSDLTLRHEDHHTNGVHWYLGLWNTEGSNFHTPREVIHNSGYMARTMIAGARIENGDQVWSLRLLASMGRDIGKPDRENNPNQTTTNPYRYDHFLTAGWTHRNFLNRGSLDVLFNLNPFRYQLERVNRPALQKEISNTTGLNSTLKLVYSEAFGDRIRIRTGIDFYLRNNIRIDNFQDSPDGSSFSIPLDGADRLDRAWFLSVQTEPTPRWSINAGIRVNHNTISPGSRTLLPVQKDQNLVGELGLMFRPLENVSLFAKTSTSYRTPSLSETYYTGITGRKWVIANPRLKPETGAHLDAGIRIEKERWGISGYIFSYRIHDMIERYRLPDDTYTHDNVQKGQIRGSELFLHYRPIDSMELTGSWTRYRGRTDDGTPLNDVPASRLELAGQLFSGHWSGQLAWLHVKAKHDPGPAESTKCGFNTLRLRLSYFVSSHIQLYLKANNLNDRLYYPTADPDIPAAPGRSVTLGIRLVRSRGYGE